MAISNVEELKKAIGIVGYDVVQTVVQDIRNILSRKTSLNAKLVEHALDGYLLALSRMMELNVAWNCVVRAFDKTEIPDKYYTVFNIRKEEKVETVSGETLRSGEQRS